MLLAWQAAFKISDKAIISLLQCLQYLISLIGTVFCFGPMTKFAQMIPKTLISLRRWIRINFCQYVVCKTCMRTYTLEESYITARNGSKIPKRCWYIPFYNHPHKASALGKKCGYPLTQLITSTSGKEFIRPIRTYCYQKLAQSLQSLVERPGFLKKFEEWRQTDSRYCNGRRL